MTCSASLINESVVCAVLCDYYPEWNEEALMTEARQIAREMEIALYDRIRYRDHSAYIMVFRD